MLTGYRGYHTVTSLGYFYVPLLIKLFRISLFQFLSLVRFVGAIAAAVETVAVRRRFTLFMLRQIMRFPFKEEQVPDAQKHDKPCHVKQNQQPNQDIKEMPIANKV